MKTRPRTGWTDHLLLNGPILGRRRALATVVSAGLFLAGLAACSSGGGATAVGSTPCAAKGAQGSAHGPATISIAYSSTQEFNANNQAVEWFNELKTTFQKEHPGVTVQLEPIGGSYDDFVQKVELMLRSPSTTPDVIHEWSEQVGGQVEAGQLTPLNKYLDSWEYWKYFPQAIRLGGVPGPNIYQMISGVNDYGLYYNVSQFRQAGIPVPWQPTSWQAILAAARTIKAKVSGTIPLWVYAGNQLYDQTTRENFLPLLQGTGSPVTKGLKWVVSSKGLTSVFDFYHTIFSSGLGPSESYLANPSADSTVDGTLMPKQKVAIALVGNWDGSWWIPGGPTPWSQGATAYHVAQLPTESGAGYANQAQGSTFVMTCASRHQLLAADLLKLAESPQFNLLHVLWTGEVPPQTDLLSNPTYLRSVPYFNQAESSWLKDAAFTPSYNYEPYATCVGEITGQIEASGLSVASAAQEFKSCATRGIGASAVTSSGG